MHEFHYEFFEGYYNGPTTTTKVLQARYYWLTSFHDPHKTTQECDISNRYMGKRRQPTMPLKPMVIEEPFQHWSLDFIGVMNPNSSIGYKFILTITDYFTRWSEAIPCKIADQEVVIKMIRRLITYFGIPKTIIFDNNIAFTKVRLFEFVAEYDIY